MSIQVDHNIYWLSDQSNFQVEYNLPLPSQRRLMLRCRLHHRKFVIFYYSFRSNYQVWFYLDRLHYKYRGYLQQFYSYHCHLTFVYSIQDKRLLARTYKQLLVPTIPLYPSCRFQFAFCLRNYLRFWLVTGKPAFQDSADHRISYFDFQFQYQQMYQGILLDMKMDTKMANW